MSISRKTHRFFYLVSPSAARFPIADPTAVHAAVLFFEAFSLLSPTSSAAFFTLGSTTLFQRVTMVRSVATAPLPFDRGQRLLVAGQHAVLVGAQRWEEEVALAAQVGPELHRGAAHHEPARLGL